MLIRKIEIKDIRENEKKIKELLREMLERKFSKCENKVIETYLNMEKFVQDGSAILLGAFEEEIIGFIWAYQIRKKTYHINYFGVEAEHRSLGIGQRLLEELYRIAKINEIETIELLVEAHNDKAIKKYKKNDFKEKYIKMEKKL